MIERLDSFGNMDETTVRSGRRYDQFFAFSSTITAGSSVGRNGYGVRMKTNSTGNGFDTYLITSLHSDHAEVIIGFAFKVPNELILGPIGDGRSQSTRRLLTFLDGYQSQCSLHLTPSQRLAVYSGSGTTLLARSSKPIPNEHWHYVEWRAQIHATTGTTRVRLNGQELSEMNVTGVNTAATGNAFMNSYLLGNGSSGGAWYFQYSDLYFIGVGGGDRNAFLGDVMVTAPLPTGNGAIQQWEPTSGTSHQTLVDDATPNTTDNVRTNTAGNVELFTYPNPTPTVGTVLAVAPNYYARKDNAGVARIAPHFYDGSTAVSGSEIYLTPEYQLYNRQVFERNPISSAQWPLNISTIAMGVKRTG